MSEFDFRYNQRSGLGVDDWQRTEKLAEGIKGKRLTYRRPRRSGKETGSTDNAPVA